MSFLKGLSSLYPWDLFSNKCPSVLEFGGHGEGQQWSGY